MRFSELVLLSWI